jgi:exosortase
MRIAWLPIAYLLLAVPLPKWLYVDLTLPLRRLASTVAAEVMPLFAPGLQTEAQAVVIDYVMPGMPPGTLNVEEACSGMRLMMAFVALGVAMAYLDPRPLWHRLVMVLACVPVAILCNAIRVTTTGLFFVYGQPDLARGTPHQLLGIGTLGIALVMFAAVRWVLDNLFVEAETEASNAA